MNECTDIDACNNEKHEQRHSINDIMHVGAHILKAVMADVESDVTLNTVVARNEGGALKKGRGSKRR